MEVLYHTATVCGKIPVPEMATDFQVFRSLFLKLLDPQETYHCQTTFERCTVAVGLVQTLVIQPGNLVHSDGQSPCFNRVNHLSICICCFHSYVKLPEGSSNYTTLFMEKIVIVEFHMNHVEYQSRLCTKIQKKIITPFFSQSHSVETGDDKKFAPRFPDLHSLLLESCVQKDAVNIPP